MRRFKEWLEIIASIGVALLVGAAILWIAYSNYTQCREDGYTATACRSMMMNGAVVVEAGNK